MKKKNKKVNAGILIIGNEILSGRTQDKNVSFISNWLNERLPGCKVVGEVRDHGRRVTHINPEIEFDEY